MRGNIEGFDDERRRLVVNAWYSGVGEKWYRRKGRTLGAENSPVARFFGYASAGFVLFSFGVVSVMASNVFLAAEALTEEGGVSFSPDIILFGFASLVFCFFVFSFRWMSFAWDVALSLLLGRNADMCDDCRASTLETAYRMFGKESEKELREKNAWKGRRV